MQEMLKFSYISKQIALLYLYIRLVLVFRLGIPVYVGSVQNYTSRLFPKNHEASPFLCDHLAIGGKQPQTLPKYFHGNFQNFLLTGLTD